MPSFYVPPIAYQRRSASQRFVIDLVYFQERTTPDVAGIAGIKRGTAKPGPSHARGPRLTKLLGVQGTVTALA